MKENKKTKVIIITVAVVVLAVIVVSSILLLNRKNTVSVAQNDNPGAIDLTDYPNTGDVIIRSASYVYAADGKIDGFLVSVSSKGYEDMIQMDITFDNTGSIVKSVVIKGHKETENYGDKITDSKFLDQFTGIAPPVVLSAKGTSDLETADTVDTDTTDAGTNTNNTTEAEEETQDQSTADQDEKNNATDTNILWADGTYEAEEAEFDEQGFKDMVSLTIENGKITEVIWDAYNKDGELKSLLAADGAYEMTTTGLNWQEQATEIANFLIEKQSTDAISFNAEGKTDVVTGVSISVKDFITLVKECLQQATSKSQVKNSDSNSETTDPQTKTEDTIETADTVEITPSAEPEDSLDSTDTTSNTIDAVSGATVSSSAVVAGINKAYSFIQEYVLKK